MENSYGAIFAPWNPQNCTIPVWHVAGITVSNPLMFVAALTGVLIGLHGYKISTTRQTKSWLIYALMFATFACMNFSGLFLNVFFKPKNFETLTPADGLTYFLAFADSYFSSAVCVCFLFCALVDIGVLNLDKSVSRHVIAGGYVLLFVGWYAGPYGLRLWNSFKYLYLGLTVVGSIGFFVIQLVSCLINRRWAAIGWLVCSVVVGLAVGLGTTFFSGKWVCDHLHYLNGFVIWYFCSDFALWGLVQFFVSSRDAEPEGTQKSLPVLSEKQQFIASLQA